MVQSINIGALAHLRASVGLIATLLGCSITKLPFQPILLGRSLQVAYKMADIQPTVVGDAAKHDVARHDVALTDEKASVHAVEDPSKPFPTEEEWATLPKVPGHIPWQAWTVAVCEFAERFSYYGTTAVCMFLRLRHLLELKC